MALSDILRFFFTLRGYSIIFLCQNHKHSSERFPLGKFPSSISRFSWRLSGLTVHIYLFVLGGAILGHNASSLQGLSILPIIDIHWLQPYRSVYFHLLLNLVGPIGSFTHKARLREFLQLFFHFHLHEQFALFSRLMLVVLHMWTIISFTNLAMFLPTVIETIL